MWYDGPCSVKRAVGGEWVMMIFFDWDFFGGVGWVVWMGGGDVQDRMMEGRAGSVVESMLHYGVHLGGFWE